jgi:CRP-like cAMP-binding protein
VEAVNSSSAPRAVPLLSVPGSGILNTLRNLAPKFLEGLTPSELEPVVAAATQVRAVANSVITYQDRPAEHLYLLLTGRARYFFLTETGKKIILLWIPPGQTFGGGALVTPPSAYLVSAETVRNSSMLVWDRAKMRSLVARCPRLLQNAVSETHMYLVAYRAAHISMIFDTAPERLAYVLTSLASGIGQKVDEGVELNVSNEELANEANVTPFTASRLLSEWQRRGMVVKGRGKILLRSPELLLRHAT